MSNTIIVPGDAGNVSDGYHTFNELYDHRNALFVNIVLAHPDMAFKTWKDHDGHKQDGWCIVGLNTPHGQISYHLRAGYWHILDIRKIEYNADYDKHDGGDVIARLLKLAGVEGE